MNRSIRIGLIAEGEAELGTSVPYISPEDGGKVIDRNNEGALHTLIRRELREFGLPDCEFVHRHPSLKERGIKLRTGHSILDRKYLAQVVSVWQPSEIDMVVIVVDADDVLPQRQRDLESALNTIRDNHLDANEQPIRDRSVGGLAIRNFETWLLADTETTATLLNVTLQPIANIEAIENTKVQLEDAIAISKYLENDTTNQRPLKIRWSLAAQINLNILKANCPTGYAVFAQSLHVAAKAVVRSMTP